MLYVKMMSNESLCDSHPNKHFSILPVLDTDELTFNSIEVDNGEHAPAVFITKADGTVICRALIGNAYVMNEAGKTIASHGC